MIYCQCKVLIVNQILTQCQASWTFYIEISKNIVCFSYNISWQATCLLNGPACCISSFQGLTNSTNSWSVLWKWAWSTFYHLSAFIMHFINWKPTSDYWKGETSRRMGRPNLKMRSVSRYRLWALWYCMIPDFWRPDTNLHNTDVATTWISCDQTWTIWGTTCHTSNKWKTLLHVKMI